MAETPAPAATSKSTQWREVSLALLVGIIVLGSSVFLVTVVQAPIGPPIETAPLFVWNTAAASIALVLLWQDTKYGYAASVLTGLLVLISLSLIGTGVYGRIQPGSSPLGPLSYAALAIALIGTTVAAWRNQIPIQPPKDEEPAP
ncbi:hypothetical protein [Haloarcula sp. JP-L23]|uniref:hypothetical protein n=1 Tax=Haloarcula sp. JP-L23 TaxID=2716717 RepID=UPI00140F0055|nr:hypothetical protein G9465_19445 [Haloarcula sp. JP-L23]